MNNLLSTANCQLPTVLGIETSCDETAAAIVRADGEILANVVLSQISEHQPYGGVVPEIAARAHITHLLPVVGEALKQASITLDAVDAVAATCGPGLIGGVIVGAMTGKTLASALKKPFIAVNHLEGHALTARLTHHIPFPYLLLLVSGGHCQFVLIRSIGDYEKLGATMDDAIGEAFDKTAKMLGLSYPGGPAVERMAEGGDARAFDFTVPLKGREGCDFSFSGLKTAVRTAALEIQQRSGTVTEADKRNICASFQRVVGESVLERTQNAIAIYRARLSPAEAQTGQQLVIAGGVAANRYVRGLLEGLAAECRMRMIAPPVKLCTDNAAMIAWAGCERLALGLIDDACFAPRARWPLEELRQE